jgi:GxxExxY protein
MNADLEQATTQDDQELPSRRFGGLHADVTELVLKVFYEVYNELGGGFLESVYHKAFAMALRQAGLTVTVEEAIPVHFRGVVVGDFRADLTVNGCVLLELKAVSALDRAHEGQILNYLRATDFETGLLLNFGPRPQFKRLVLENRSKRIRVYPCLSAVESLEGSKQ